MYNEGKSAGIAGAVKVLRPNWDRTRIFYEDPTAIHFNICYFSSGFYRGGGGGVIDA